MCLVPAATVQRMRPRTLQVVPFLALLLSCGGEGPGVSTDLPPGPKPVASVAISFPGAVMRVSETAQATAETRDANGIDLRGRAVTWASSAPDVASISGAGLVTALTAGLTTISAISEGKSASLALTVVRRLEVVGTDAELEPGKTFTIRGDGLRLAKVTIAGSDAPVLDATDSVLVVSVPTAPWTPCVAANAQGTIQLTSAGQAVDLTRPVAEKPQVLDLAVGGYADIAANVLARGCRLQLRSGGTYLALPFVPQRADGSRIPASDSVAVTVRVDGGSASSGDAVASGALPEPRAARLFAAARDRSTDQASRDFVVVRPSLSKAASACALPTLGGTVTVQTIRDSTGRLVGMSSGGDGPKEPWTLVAESRSVAMFTDTATLRRMRTNAMWQTTFDSVATLIDTAVTPFIQSRTRGYPDYDGNGKVIVYVSGVAGSMSNYAFNSSLRSDCGDDFKGEAIFLNWTTDPQYGPGVDITPLVHELAHIADYAWNERTTYSPWAIEGFAVVMQQAYHSRDDTADPLVANFATLPVPRPGGSNVYCFAGPRAVMANGIDGPGWYYALGCSMVGYLMQLHRAQYGGTIRDAAIAWTKTPNALTMEDADSYFGMSRGASRSFGHWLLSWYADDYVAGIAPELRQPMWDLRRMWAKDFSRSFPYPAPDLVLSAGTPSTSFRLGAPDVRYVELGALGNAMLSVTRTGTTAADLNLMVFRAR